MDQSQSDRSGRTRRRFLVSAVGTATVVLAGCAGGDGGDGDRETVPGSTYPAIDTWLTETDIGGAASTYDGTLVDLRERGTVTVDVGASGNNGSFGFGPAGIVVSTGTTVDFNWTGQGNPHNVEAQPGDQLGESDYTFRSGDREGGTGVKFSYDFDDAGVALYHCQPHLAIGMKGGIAVE